MHILLLFYGITEILPLGTYRKHGIYVVAVTFYFEGYRMENNVSIKRNRISNYWHKTTIIMTKFPTNG